MEKSIEKRPDLNSAISPDDFQSFYWLKNELASFCRANGISASGCKIEIAARIEQFLATGKVIPASRNPVVTSNFDWKNTELHLNTKITDNYKNTENVRAFMTLHIGSHFKFNTVFMNWAKANAGKSLADAIDEWNRIYTLHKNKEHKSVIAPQFEFNRYIRDFMADNPGKTRAAAIYFWKLKRQQRDDNNYSATDLLSLE